MIIETVVRKYLQDALKVNAYTEKESPMPAEYVLIEKTGSGGENFIYTAQLAIQSYSTSQAEAADLNERVKAAMAEINKLTNVSKCTLNSDYNDPDENIKIHRYQAVFDLVYM